MYPQSELDNYKLKVELLQDKLLRSEEQRQHLEHQLEQTLYKRSEHDKSVQMKTRQRYKQFLDEQEKRNQRNKLLVEMLERIDQQAGALSARSERLKMMKMQYEMYFAKLVQSQTLRCIQSTAAAVTPTHIPVLLPTTPVGNVIATAPINSNDHDTAAATYQLDTNFMPTAAGAAAATTTYCLTPCSNSSVAASNNATAIPTLSSRHWTFAMATPTPGGVLLTSTPAAAVPGTLAPMQQNYVFSTGADCDYLQSPIGYIPRTPLQPLPVRTSVYFNGRDELVEGDRSSSGNRKKAHNDEEPTSEADDEKHDKITIVPAARGSVAAINSAVAADTILEATSISSPTRKQNEQLQQQLPMSAKSWSPPSTTFIFDKLPKTALTMTEKDFTQTAEAADGKNDDVVLDDKAATSGEPQLVTRFSELSERRSSAEAAKPPSSTDVAAHKNPNEVAAKATYRQSINETWQLPAEPPMTEGWLTADRLGLRLQNDSSRLLTDKNTQNSLEASERAEPYNEYVAGGLTGISVANGAAEPTESAQSDAQIDNQSMLSKVASPQHVSIENIENAIYGELVNPPAASDKIDILNATQELLGELVTPPQPEEGQSEQFEETALEPEQMASKQSDSVDYRNYTPAYGSGDSAAHAGDANYNQDAALTYEPTYATAEDTTNAEGYAATPETAYSGEDTTAADYMQFPDSNAAQQDYSNLDYANYDASQYAGGYDANVYPGYTYDEATGQYTADPTQQYLPNDAYAGQNYEQNPYAVNEQGANYDYAAYEQNVDNSPATYAPEPPAEEFKAEEHVVPETAADGPEEVVLPKPPTVTTTAPVDSAGTGASAAPVTTAPVTAAPVKAPKPILATSSGDKQAAPNDAQKKKKRVNFVDSSETDDSSTAKAAGAATSAGAGGGGGGGADGDTGGAASSESDFDFSTGDEIAPKTTTA